MMSHELSDKFELYPGDTYYHKYQGSETRVDTQTADFLGGKPI